MCLKYVFTGNALVKLYDFVSMQRLCNAGGIHPTREGSMDYKQVYAQPCD